jgi:small multidrug resistance pump
VIGVLFFKENVNAIKAVSILLIVAGVVGLNLGGVAH